MDINFWDNFILGIVFFSALLYVMVRIKQSVSQPGSACNGCDVSGACCDQSKITVNRDAGKRPKRMGK